MLCVPLKHSSPEEGGKGPGSGARLPGWLSLRPSSLVIEEVSHPVLSSCPLNPSTQHPLAGLRLSERDEPTEVPVQQSWAHRVPPSCRGWETVVAP